MTIISEAHKDFEELASEKSKKAAETARRAAEFSEEQIEENKKALGLTSPILAKYKIEVTFGPNRTTNGPNLVGIQVWESGKLLNGGGDDLMYWCKDNRADHDEGCWGLISSDNIRGGMALCPSCNMASNADLLTSMRIGRVTTHNLSNELVALFHQLGANADIYLKFHKTDIHYVALERAKGPEVARRLKGLAIYPLRNILKDTSNGADLGKRFVAFLTN